MQERSTEELHRGHPCESKLTEHTEPRVKSKKTVVTGGGGYLGYNLGCALLKSGVAVVLFDVRKPKWEIPNGADFFKGDVRDYDAVFKACEGADCVFHVAACGMSGLEQASTIFLTFSLFILVRAEICLHTGLKSVVKGFLCETEVGYKGQVIHAGNEGVCKQRNIPRLIYTSTVNVVFGGNTIEEGDEETVPYFPLEKHFNHYSRTKAIADQMVLAANGTLLKGGDKLHTCVLRPPGIYGPEEQRHLPRINIQRRLFNFKFGNHKVQMNWVHIGNLVQAHLLAAEALTSEKDYVAVTTVMEYLHLALKPVFIFTPFLTRNEVWNVTVTHTFRIDKARNQLGYKPKKFSLADSVDHYLKTRPICQEDHTFLKMLFAFGLLLSDSDALHLSEPCPSNDYPNSN
ncbi:putative short-chain dehydrogenase/reductase family 42E member 2 [Aix galericulata]|nr:putative short-chain dehydrogenase/reductase family 42E member 2 [Aix galericulata]